MLPSDTDVDKFGIMPKVRRFKTFSLFLLGMNTRSLQSTAPNSSLLFPHFFPKDLQGFHFLLASKFWSSRDGFSLSPSGLL